MKQYNSIHLWDLNGYDRDLYIKLSKNGRELIKDALKKKYGLFKIAAKENNLEYTGLLHLLREGALGSKFRFLYRLVL